MPGNPALRLLFLALLLVSACLPQARETRVDPGRVQVYFSPGGGAEAAIVKQIDGAAKEVLVQAYGFTNKEIIAALRRARKAGVAVSIILDKSCAIDHDGTQAKNAAAAAPTAIDSEHAIAHNKVIVIDQARVITGSFNFTQAAAQRNAENVLIIDSPELAAIYKDNFQKHLAHSQPFVAK